MVWNIMRNKNYTSKKDYYIGKCPRKKYEIAEISIQLNGKKYCKTDLGITFSSYLCNCNLLKENESLCIDCPLLEKYNNEHNF